MSTFFIFLNAVSYLFLSYCARYAHGKCLYGSNIWNIRVFKKKTKQKTFMDIKVSQTIKLN